MAFGMLYSADVLGLACLSGFKIRVANPFFPQKLLCKYICAGRCSAAQGFTDIPPPGSSQGLGYGGVCREPGAAVEALQTGVTCSRGSQLSVRFYSSDGYLKHSAISSGFCRQLFTHYCDTVKHGSENNNE